MKTPTRLDEKTLGQKAYQSYLHGRLAGCLPEDSAPSTTLVRSYLMPDRLPLEVYAFARGLATPGGDVLSAEQLLDVLHEELPPEPKLRRPRRPDTRWKVQ